MPTTANIFHGPANTSQAFVANQEWYESIDILTNVTVDAIEWTNGTVVSGNIKYGIYRANAVSVNGQTNVLLNSTLISSGSIAQGTASSAQIGSLTALALTPGKYFLSIMADNATATYMRHGNLNYHNNLAYTTNEGSFNLAATAVAGTPASNNIPGLRLRTITNF